MKKIGVFIFVLMARGSVGALPPRAQDVLNIVGALGAQAQQSASCPLVSSCCA